MSGTWARAARPCWRLPNERRPADMSHGPGAAQHPESARAEDSGDTGGVNGVASAGSILTHADPALVKALARAFRYQRLLDEGRYTPMSEIATRERVECGYLGSIMRLTRLAPDIVEALLNGQVSADVSQLRLMEPVPT